MLRFKDCGHPRDFLLDFLMLFLTAYFFRFSGSGSPYDTVSLHEADPTSDRIESDPTGSDDWSDRFEVDPMYQQPWF